MRVRLLSVAHFKAGKNITDVPRTLDVGRRMVNEWVANYFKGVVSGHESKKHREDLLYCLPSKKPN
jgi:hypothetical protein